MKKILFILVLMAVNRLPAQTLTDTSYTASNNKTYTKGHDIKIGMGSGMNKDFVFIYTSPASLAGKLNLGASWAGYNFKIKEIKKTGNEKRGFKIYLVCWGGNLGNYWVEIEQAIKTGEVE